MSATVAVVVHPHPGMGGDRDHPLVVAVALGLEAAGIPAVRPDLPDPDLGRSRVGLEALAVDHATRHGAERIVLVGYSWGAATSAGARPAGLVARVLVAPPAPMLDAVADDGVPTLLLVPAHDQFGPAEAVAPIVESWSDAQLEIVDGCDHFLLGAIDPIAARTVEWARAAATRP